MAHVLVVEARFYAELADQLVKGALAELYGSKITHERISVPGCFELPAAVAMGAATRKYDGFIALGCVIRGETTHYDVVCNESTRGLNELAMRNNLAIGMGIITAENMAQAKARADMANRNLGGKAALACIQMMALREKFGIKRA